MAKQGVKRKEMDLADYLDMCRQYALSQVDKQRDDFKRLGVSADWDNPYVTLDPSFEADQIRVFGAMADKGYIYRGQSRFIGHGLLSLLLLRQRSNIMILILHHFTMLIGLKMVRAFLILTPISWFGRPHHLR
ncbi:isoleucyl-tRNA synthetase [Streptococcus equi subsp. zooepidemicus]|uniref:Isoleucyl-tRNA synthetase n=1 Tax=Streptococcus equi subsp. zooepidemicus TaxID=40041 RepID=A0AAX2LJA6_STRSZ|nr:isoleucyl-tRNA synthetase [Streptococcus equi subsp. zooepidemicus]